MKFYSFNELIGVWDGELPILDFSLRKIYEWRDEFPESEGNSNIEGWQRTGMHKDGRFSPLMSLISNKSREYIDHHDVKPPRYIEIVHAFANINGPGASNCMHHHTYGQISGVYWLKAPRNSGDLIIMSPFHNQYLNTSCVSKIDRNAMVIEPKANTGVFFNSNLVHYVDQNRSTKDRVSVAFHILLHP